MSDTFIRNFSLLDVKATAVTATDTSQTHQFSNEANVDVLLVNGTATTIFVRTGDSTVVADAEAMPIISGEKGVYNRGQAQGRSTHLAFFVASGTAALTIVEGLGS